MTTCIEPGCACGARLSLRDSVYRLPLRCSVAASPRGRSVGRKVSALATDPFSLRLPKHRARSATDSPKHRAEGNRAEGNRAEGNRAEGNRNTETRGRAAATERCLRNRYSISIKTVKISVRLKKGLNGFRCGPESVRH
jgi:hypothetical protein